MRSTVLPALALASLGLLAGCAGGVDGGGGDALSPTDAMSQAEQHLDSTSGVKVDLSTDDSFDGDYLKEAEGVVNDQPAFTGTATGTFQGFTATVDVVSVDGTFQVKLPVVGYKTYQPADLCAPDPALLLDPDSGVASILTAATGVTAGDAKLDPDLKLEVTPYTATVPTSAVKKVLPCAAGDSYAATFDVSSDGYLRSADLTGDFFGDGSDVTYHVKVEAYDVEQVITAP